MSHIKASKVERKTRNWLRQHTYTIISTCARTHIQTEIKKVFLITLKDVICNEMIFFLFAVVLIVYCRLIKACLLLTMITALCRWRQCWKTSAEGRQGTKENDRGRGEERKNVIFSYFFAMLSALGVANLSVSPPLWSTLTSIKIYAMRWHEILYNLGPQWYWLFLESLSLQRRIVIVIIITTIMTNKVSYKLAFKRMSPQLTHHAFCSPCVCEFLRIFGYK